MPLDRPNKPIVSITLSADILEALDAYASGRSISRSAAADRLLRYALGAYVLDAHKREGARPPRRDRAPRRTT
jgi:metal-responsive CopG/Arc/MetJ family transcriptional regulator